MHRTLPKLLVTGGAGFIGSEFVRQGVGQGYNITVIDKLTYAGDLSRLKEVEKKIDFCKVDIAQKKEVLTVFRDHKPDVVVHFAAETHVDRSIHQDVTPFIKTNVSGTQNLIDAARQTGITKFIHISTDEVYGQIKEGKFTEKSPLQPNNPYSATKAAADHMIRAAIHTHKFPAVIVRPSNNYGPWQYPEKFVPVIIFKALRNKKIPVYGKGLNVREWLYVGDTASAIFHIIKKGKIGKIYNVGSSQEKKNLDTAKSILKLLDKPQGLIQYVKDRPGHDFRYSLRYKELESLGWKPSVKFKEGIKQTVQWNLEHISWLESKLSYLKRYWKKVYT